MLILQSVPPAFGEKSASSYCLKVMLLLNMSGLEWRPDYTVSPQQAPRGKLPALVDGEVIIPDSTDIARYLERVHGCDFTPGLSALEKAQSHAIARMFEEHFSQVMTYERWVLDAVWPYLKPEIFPNVPDQVVERIRQSVKEMSVASGMGRLTPEEVRIRMALDFDAVEAMLWEGEFLFGDAASYADASVAAFMISVLAQPVETLLQVELKSRPRLVNYANRVKAELGVSLGHEVAA